jgi:Kelch motif
MGGFASKRTTPQTADLQDLVPIPGIVSYNTVDGTWKNESSTGYSAFGTAVLAQLQYVPTFGAGGLLLVMGGSTPNAVKWTDRGSNYVSFEKVNIYDLASKSWHAQTASGAIPNARSRFCSVGARGDNGTYEIFIFGGHVASASGESLASDTEAQKKRNIALDEVLVLSLPGFVWTKANYTAATPRVMHACNIAGNRQMVVTGGLNPATADQKQLLSTRDNWTQGIGVFDMTTLQWKDSYDADAEAYVTPEVVKSWYAANGAYPATWDNAVVEGLFTQSGNNPYLSIPTPDADVF